MKGPSLKLFPGMLETSPKVMGWPSLSAFNRMRRRLNSRLRSGQSPTSNLAKLQTSFDPSDTIRSLRAHKWSAYDGQYVFLAILGIFCLSVMESPGAIVKTLVSSLLLVSLLMPVTRQFTLPFLPIAGWLVLFWCCRYVIINCPNPRHHRRHHSQPPLPLPRKKRKKDKGQENE